MKFYAYLWGKTPYGCLRALVEKKREMGGVLPMGGQAHRFKDGGSLFFFGGGMSVKNI